MDTADTTTPSLSSAPAPTAVHDATYDVAKRSRLNLRATTRQEHLIRRAAAATERSVTDFVLESATRHAEAVLADRRWFVLSDTEWAAFETALDAPLEHTEKLREFLSERHTVDLSDV